MPMPVVWVPKDVESHFPPHPSGMVPGGQSLLAKDRVRYVGDQLAVVVAETRQQAFDALDAIDVTYEPLPVVLDPEAAMKPGAPQLHDAVPEQPDGPFVDRRQGRGRAGDRRRGGRRQAALRQPADDGEHGRDARLRWPATTPTTGDYTLWTQHPADLPGPAPDQPVRPRHPVQQAAGDRPAVRRQPGLEGLPLRGRPADAPPLEGPRPAGQVDRHPGRPGALDRPGPRPDPGRHPRRHTRRPDHGPDLHRVQQRRRLPGHQRARFADRPDRRARSPASTRSTTRSTRSTSSTPTPCRSVRCAARAGPRRPS